MRNKDHFNLTNLKNIILKYIPKDKITEFEPGLYSLNHILNHNNHLITCNSQCPNWIHNNNPKNDLSTCKLPQDNEIIENTVWKHSPCIYGLSKPSKKQKYNKRTI